MIVVKVKSNAIIVVDYGVKLQTQIQALQLTIIRQETR